MMAHLDPKASHHLDRHGHVGLRDQLVADHDVDGARPLCQGSCHEQRRQVLAADRASQFYLQTGAPLSESGGRCLTSLVGVHVQGCAAVAGVLKALIELGWIMGLMTEWWWVLGSVSWWLMCGCRHGCTEQHH